MISAQEIIGLSSYNEPFSSSDGNTLSDNLLYKANLVDADSKLCCPMTLREKVSKSVIEVIEKLDED